MNDITTPTPQPPATGELGWSQRRKKITVASAIAGAGVVVALAAWLFPDPLGKLDQKKRAPGARSVPTPQEETPDPTAWPPEPDLRPTPHAGRTRAQDPGPRPGAGQPVDPEPSGTNGREEEPAKVPKPPGSPGFTLFPKPDRPSPVETAPLAAPVEEPPGQRLPTVPSPQEPEVESSSIPEVTVGDQIDVVAEALEEPRGPRHLTPLRYPPVPADALRSRLSSEQMVCVVTVERDGKASADCGDNARDLPQFLLHQAKGMLEEAQWQPATDEKGEPRRGRVAVRFTWRR